jgi:hypothetical protein
VSKKLSIMEMTKSLHKDGREGALGLYRCLRSIDSNSNMLVSDKGWSGGLPCENVPMLRGG